MKHDIPDWARMRFENRHWRALVRCLMNAHRPGLKRRRRSYWLRCSYKHTDAYERFMRSIDP